MLDVAQERFLRDGYAATTISSIAADAHVSPETIYKPGKIMKYRAMIGRGSSWSEPLTFAATPVASRMKADA